MAISSALRTLSHVLLSLEAVALVFLTVLGGVFLLGASGEVWSGSWADWDLVGAMIWISMVLSLVCAWWLLLAYFYCGHQGARRVPAIVWVFTTLIALCAVL